MNKKYLLGILFFGSLWGFSEAILGGFLYRYNMEYSSVYLTVIAVSILTVAAVYLPGKGVASAIAAFAMLYKFLNTPFFACHLLGILLLGVCYDLFFNGLKVKSKSTSAALTVYANYTLFALMITYVFRYAHWIEGGLSKVADHVLMSGTLAALGCVLIVPLSHKLGQWLQTNKAQSDIAGSFARGRLAIATSGMWLFAVAAFAMQLYRS